MAIELGVRTAARAAEDVDVVFGGDADELLDAAFAAPYCEFAFRRGASPSWWVRRTDGPPAGAGRAWPAHDAL